MKTKYWLLIIFCLALFLRLYKLGTLPFNFHEDEILTGYVGRFILINGRDLYNNSWPLLYFNKFGDYYIILPMYIKGLFTFIFGVNEFAVRFPTALLGALAIFPVYYLAVWTFRNKTVGLLSAFLLAIIPWHIVMSRADAEGVMGSTIYLDGLVLVLYSLRQMKIKTLFIASILFFIAYFIYHPFRVLIPLSLLPIPFVFMNIKKDKKYSGTLLTMIVIAFALTLYISTTFWGSGRFSQTSIFSPLSGVNIKIQELIYDEGKNNILTAKIFHNKAIGFGREFIHQYISYFSPEFLFLQGGRSYAYRVPEQGLFYISFIGLGILSMIFLSGFLTFQKHEDKGQGFRLIYLMYLLLLAPFPSGLTVLDGPNVHRSVTMSLILTIFFAYGLYAAWNIRYKLLRLGYVFIFLLAIEFVYFWHQYAQHADFFNAIYRNDGQKQLVEYVKNNIDSKTPVIMPVQNTMPLYYLFYTNDFDRSYATKFQLDARIDKINNVTFFNDECPSKKLLKTNLDPKTILVDSHNCEPDIGKYDIIATITGKNPLLAFKILKLKPQVLK